MEAPASNATAAPDAIETTREEAFNTIGNAFDEIERGLGLTPEPKPEKIAEPQKEEAVQEESQETEKTEEQPEQAEATEEIPGVQTPKAKMKWGELRKKADELDRLKPEYEKYKGELENLKKSQSEEVEQLRKERDLLKQDRESIEGELYISRIQATREYKETVINPLTDLYKTAKEIAETNDMKPEQLLDLIYQNNRKTLGEAISGFSELDRQDVSRIYRDIHAVEGRRKELEAKPREAYETSERNRAEQEQKHFREISQKRVETFKSLRPGIQEAINQLPEDQRVDLDTVLPAIEQMQYMPENLKVYSVTAGAILPKILESNKAMAEELKALKAENTSLRNGSPRADRGTTAQAPKEQKKEKEVSSAEDLAADFMSKARGLGIAR